MTHELQNCVRCIPFALLLLCVSAGGCAPALMRSTASEPLTGDQIAQLWIEPEDIAARNLFWGSGGPATAPMTSVRYRVTAHDHSGYSRGYEVKGSDGREWKIKLGKEVRSEIVSSRLLWAIGFHQAPMHFLRGWRAGGVRHEDEGADARFRLKSGLKSRGEWSWQQNPYVGTRELKGLLVANLILNNWDLKAPNNRIVAGGDAFGGPRTWFVVQDLGATLGASKWPVGNRSDVNAFESQNLIERLADGRIVFDYHARHGELLEDISPADVVWTCRLLSELTDRQWRDAFRAANYADALAVRYIAKLRAKVEEGLTLMPQAGNNP